MPDLYAEAARWLGLPRPIGTRESAGLLDGAWLLPARPAPDRFLDGEHFEPGKSAEPYAGDICCVAQEFGQCLKSEQS
jgi:hypothetical protein